jgi:ABC-type branched-subunit amino acid transport system substrate-binding protein
MNKIAYLLIAFIASAKLHASLETIQGLLAYTKHMQEYPMPDNNDLDDPNYTSYYKSIIPGRFGRFMHKIGLKPTSWEIGDLQKQLLKIIERNERKNISGRQVMRILLDQPSTLYVFGDIQAQLHSLVRSLTFLYNSGIIDKNLIIKDPNTYIIFNGNAIDRAPYSLECLFVLTLLLELNPDNVFYVRGTHEDKDYWQNFGLKRELKQRAAYLLSDKSSADEIPMEDLLRRFFMTLPLALYIAEKQYPLDVIRFSHTRRNNEELREEMFDDFFTTHPDKKVYTYDVRQKVRSRQTPSIKTLITAEDWFKEHRAHKGLGILDQDLGTTAWSIVSTPIMAYQKYYNFTFDAFVQIDLTVPIDKSTITLWYNDNTGPTLFKKDQTYRLTAAMPIEAENHTDTTTSEIKIGATLPLDRGLAIMGQRVKRGMDIRINQENEKGGINGQPIRAITYNNDYTPFLARQNIETLINKDKTRLIFLTIGSQIFQTLIDFVKDNRITAIFPTNGAPEFRKPELTSLVNFGPSYEDEIEILINHMLTEYGARKFLFFYQNDAYGIGLLEQAHKELKARDIHDWVDVPYARGETNFKKQADIIKNSQVDTVGLFSTAKSTEELFRQVGIDALTNKKIFGVSYLGEISFREFIKTHGLHVILGAVVPNPAKSTLEIAENYRQAMDNNKRPYDVFSFLAYICTGILIDVMHRINGQVTPEKIVEKMESYYDDKYQGLTLTFNPQTRSLARYVWIETNADEDWIEKKIKNTLS